MQPPSHKMPISSHGFWRVCWDFTAGPAGLFLLGSFNIFNSWIQITDVFVQWFFILNSDSFQRKSWFKRIAKNAGYSWLAMILFGGWPAGYQAYDAYDADCWFLTHISKDLWHLATLGLCTCLKHWLHSLKLTDSSHLKIGLNAAPKQTFSKLILSCPNSLLVSGREKMRNHLVSQPKIASFVSRHVSAPSFQARKAPPGPLCGAQHPGPWRHGSRIACWPYGWRCGGKGWFGKRSCSNNYHGDTQPSFLWVRTHKFGFWGLPKVGGFQHVFVFLTCSLGECSNLTLAHIFQLGWFNHQLDNNVVHSWSL